MQWSCPHCGIILGVADDILGTGWSFSRCYKCGGFALIRRAEVNVIKVDKAPPGEKVILPEASHDPKVLLSAKATEKAAQYMGNNNKRPLGQAAPTLSQKTPSVPPPFQTATHPLSKGHLPGQGMGQLTSALDISTAMLPEPLPEIGGQRSKSFIIPVGISAATIVMIVSGVYLFIQGQALWSKARASVSSAPAASSAQKGISQADSSLGEVAQNAANSGKLDGSTVSALVAEDSKSSGTVLGVGTAAVLSNEMIAKQKPIAAAQPVHRSDIMDRVQKSAMAPVKYPLLSEGQPEAQNGEDLSGDGSLAEKAIDKGPNNGVVKGADPGPESLTENNRGDQTESSNGMTGLKTSLVVRVIAKKAALHSGPGVGFSVVGTAVPDGRYQVVGWNDRWFKLLIQLPLKSGTGTGAGTGMGTTAMGTGMGWIRNDFVQVLSSNSTPGVSKHN